MVSLGAKGSTEQLAIWKGNVRFAWPPSSPLSWAETENGSQFVGSRVKFFRFRSTRIERRRSGIPSMIWGSGSETAVT